VIHLRSRCLSHRDRSPEGGSCGSLQFHLRAFKGPDAFAQAGLMRKLSKPNTHPQPSAWTSTIGGVQASKETHRYYVPMLSTHTRQSSVDCAVVLLRFPRLADVPFSALRLFRAALRFSLVSISCAVAFQHTMCPPGALLTVIATARFCATLRQ
jgi:hypothetical protein